jgi:peptidyl-prolyl cis-trans isomerase SurA
MLRGRWWRPRRQAIIRTAGGREEILLQVGRSMTRIAAIFLLILASTATVAAQETRIAAVVNDDMISLGDLEARIRLVLLSSQLPDNAQVRQRVTSQVLRTLIDEKLEVQEAKRYNVTVSDDDVSKAFDRLEQQNNMPKGGLEQLLSSHGISRSTLTDQIRSALIWNKLVDGKLTQSVSISDEEVKDTLARIKQEIGKSQYRVAEIFLAVDNPSQEADVKALADRLLDQIHQGASFSAVAQQFSQSPTAAVGGDLGWLTAAELPHDIGDVVQGMQVGQLSAAIRGSGGFYIVGLLERRTFGTPSPADATVTFTRVSFQFPTETATDADRQKALAAAQQVSETAKSCEDMVRIGKERAPQTSGEVRDAKIGSLPQEFQTLLASLQPGQASKPLAFRDGAGVIMPCERKEAASPIPTRDQLVDNLTRQRLETLARRYLRDLRRTAYVDLRV